jgi:hypothetical protein
MKNIFFALAIVFALQACKSDEKKIIGAWQASKVTIAGADKTADYKKNSYKETYGEGDVYSFSGDPDGKSGEGDYIWSDKTKVKRSGVSNQASLEFTVTTLSNKKLIYTCQLNGQSATFEFQKWR